MVRSGPIAYQDSRLSKGKKKREETAIYSTAVFENSREHFRPGTYYAIWKEKEHRFSEPVPYDFTLPVVYPNIVLRARDLKEAKAKIETINSKAKGIDRFDFKSKRVLRAC